jgi:hypothetical protein
MPILLYLVAAAEVVAGLLIFGSAASAIHEILGSLLIGFGFMTMALGAILAQLQRR